MSFLNIDGFNFHYEVYEGLVDNDCLFIHGNLACTLWWHPAVEVLKEKTPDKDKKGKLVVADWRGCGQSKGLKSESEIDLKIFSNDFLHLVEAEKLKNINVVGHSTGGLIGMLAILERPEFFNSLVLLDSIGPLGIESPIPVPQLLAGFKAMSESEELSNATIAATIENVDKESDFFKRLAKQTYEVDSPVWQGVPARLCNDIDITDRMSEITLPTLILHGRKDEVLPLEGSEKMQDMLPNSELQILETHGHSFNIEAPEAFVEKVESFWNQHSSRIGS